MEHAVRATILGHSLVPEGDEQLHIFHYMLDDGGAGPARNESISLRTARVIVANLPDGNALIAMLRAIVDMQPDAYAALVGRQFRDAHG
ncbi:hypothetical protein AXG89_26910 (plasmid) [Burkholderia sp. PAMC 26561]|nr:hypothetical protein AXG89_25780 [Burkholderia sp. PAMC 26561]AME27546.2 hypothetical protein AXG89_26910 [Burkholderia sp. PAMC 26561]